MSIVKQERSSPLNACRIVSLRKRAIKVTREYAWPRIADDSEKLYETVIKEKKLATA